MENGPKLSPKAAANFAALVTKLNKDQWEAVDGVVDEVMRAYESDIQDLSSRLANVESELAELAITEAQLRNAHRLAVESAQRRAALLNSAAAEIDLLASQVESAELDAQRLALYVWSDSVHRGSCAAPQGECCPECPRGIAQRVLEAAPREARGWYVKDPNGDYWLCVLHKEAVHGPGTAYVSCSGCDTLALNQGKTHE